MSMENQAELFIRVLVEEFETHRKVRKFGFSRQVKAQAKWFRQRFKADNEMSAASAEPLDCLQLMSTEPQRRLGQ